MCWICWRRNILCFFCVCFFFLLTFLKSRCHSAPVRGVSFTSHRTTKKAAALPSQDIALWIKVFSLPRPPAVFMRLGRWPSYVSDCLSCPRCFSAAGAATWRRYLFIQSAQLGGYSSLIPPLIQTKISSFRFAEGQRKGRASTWTRVECRDHETKDGGEKFKWKTLVYRRSEVFLANSGPYAAAIGPSTKFLAEEGR